MPTRKDTLREIASQIAKLEGKKSQARIGDIREILKLICVLDAKFLIENKETPFSIRGLSPVELIDHRSAYLYAKLIKKELKAKKCKK